MSRLCSYPAEIAFTPTILFGTLVKAPSPKPPRFRYPGEPNFGCRRLRWPPRWIIPPEHWLLPYEGCTPTFDGSVWAQGEAVSSGGIATTLC